MNEIWREIPGFDGRYLASSLGNLKSISVAVSHCPKGKWLKRVIPEKAIKTSSDKFGYRRTTLTHNGKRKNWLVHRLIAISFIRNPDNLPCVNHIDSCTHNNRIENLEWVDHAGNMRHAALRGRMASNSGKGMKSPAAKLTDDLVIEIKIRLADGEGPASISLDYAVTPSAISEIKSGRSWSHIQPARKGGSNERPAD